MAKNAIVSEEMAKKFASEKDTPYTRFIRGEGLDIIAAHYVPSLHTVELKAWPRRGGVGRRGPVGDPAVPGRRRRAAPGGGDAR